jgi:hypothetical protein
MAFRCLTTSHTGRKVSIQVTNLISQQVIFTHFSGLLNRSESIDPTYFWTQWRKKSFDGLQTSCKKNLIGGLEMFHVTACRPSSVNFVVEQPFPRKSVWKNSHEHSFTSFPDGFSRKQCVLRRSLRWAAYSKFQVVYANHLSYFSYELRYGRIHHVTFLNVFFSYLGRYSAVERKFRHLSIYPCTLVLISCKSSIYYRSNVI